MKLKKIMSVMIAVVLCMSAVIPVIPASALEENSDKLNYRTATDQYFVGYTDEIFKTALWSDEKTDSTAVVKSVEELQNYLSVFFENDIVLKYVEKYNAEFFDDNILIIDSLCQSCGTKPFFEIDNVVSADSTIDVSAKWRLPEESESLMSALIVQVSISKESYGDRRVNWNVYEENHKEAFRPSNVGISNKKLIDVNNIMQNPELPTGCEVVSLTILLNHLGYQANKLTMARNYLPKMDFYWSGGVYYGADFRTTFAGNPESYNAYGCYAPCIKTTADKYFDANGIDNSAQNVTGTSFDSLLSDYIANDIPVLIWITSSNLHEPMLTSVWTTPAGERVQWLAYEHCVVLTGYDMDNGLIYVSDPLVGNTSYDYNRIKQRYIDLGQQAIYIPTEKSGDGYIYGDLNDDGLVTSEDCVLILRESIDLEDFDDVHKILADLDNDGSITSNDAVEVLRYSIGLPSSTNVGEVYWK